MRRSALATILVAALCGSVSADPESDADAAYRAAVLRGGSDPASAIDDLEALGARRPVTRWTDNAWMEAARIAEVTGNHARAREDLTHALADTSDPQIVQRAKATLARLAQIGGGEWEPVAAQHAALLARVNGDDPPGALVALGKLVQDNPAYPRATSVRVAIARGWELEGKRDAALHWMRLAAATAGEDPGERTRLELARMLIRARELAEARAVLRSLADSPRVDTGARDEVGRLLAGAEKRGWIRRAVWTALGLLAVLALFTLRRDAGSWRGVGRRLVRPSLEAIVLAPLAGLLVAISLPGNPLVAHAVTTIAVAGVLVAWVSGAIGAGGTRRTLLHVACVMLAVGAVGYLAVERGVLDLLIETWRGGHALP